MHIISNYSQNYKKLKQKLVIYASLFILMTIQGIITLPLSRQTKSYNFTHKFVHGFGLVCILATHLELQVCRRPTNNICFYVNSIPQFQSEYQKKASHRLLATFATTVTRPLSLIEKMNSCFAYASFPSFMCLSFAFTG